MRTVGHQARVPRNIVTNNRTAGTAGIDGADIGTGGGVVGVADKDAINIDLNTGDSGFHRTSVVNGPAADSNNTGNRGAVSGGINLDSGKIALSYC